MPDATPEAVERPEAPSHDDADVLNAARNPEAVRNALDRERTTAREARREAASLRDQLAVVRAQLADAQARLDAGAGSSLDTAALDAESLPLAARLAARGAGLPDHAARWITGETVAELVADAHRFATSCR